MKARQFTVFTLLASIVLLAFFLPAASTRMCAQGAGTTEHVLVASNGTQGNRDSWWRASISADGRYVPTSSSASNLVDGDTNGTADIFVHDRQTGQTTRASFASNGTPGNSWSYVPSISADGRYVAFDSNASNLVSGDANSTRNLFVHDRQMGQTTRASEEDLKAKVEEMAERLERSRLLYGVEALDPKEIKEFRGRMMWDEDRETEENTKWLKNQYRGFRERLRKERLELEDLQTDDLRTQALSATQQQVVARAIEAIKETENQFDKWQQAGKSEVELGLKYHWLRFRQTEEEIKAEVQSQPVGKKEWHRIPRLYEDAGLPTISTARYLPAEAEAEFVSLEENPAAPFLLIPEVLESLEAQEAEDPCEETMWVRRISDHPDDLWGSLSAIHHTLRSTSQGQAVFSTVASGGSWAAAVIWRENDQNKNYIEQRKPSEKSTFDNTGVVANYQGKEYLANIACVVEEVNGKERSFVKAYLVDRQTGEKVFEQVVHAAELGDFDDFTGSAGFKEIGGEILAYWTHAGADGFNIKGVKWDESQNKFMLLDGYLNHTNHRACQFGRAIAYNPQTREYDFTYAFYNGNGNISAMVHKTKLNGADREGFEVMQVAKDEVLTNDDVSREVIAGRIYSLIRVAVGEKLYVAEAPVKRNGVAEIKVGMTDIQGRPIDTFYLPGGNYHRVVADIVVPQVIFTDAQGQETQEEVVALRSLRVPNKNYGDREAEEEVIAILPDPKASNLGDKWGQGRKMISEVVSDKPFSIRRLYFGDISEWLLNADVTLSEVWTSVTTGDSGIRGQDETTITVKEVCVKGKIYLPIIVHLSQYGGDLGRGAEYRSQVAQLLLDHPDYQVREVGDWMLVLFPKSV